MTHTTCIRRVTLALLFLLPGLSYASLATWPYLQPRGSDRYERGCECGARVSFDAIAQVTVPLRPASRR